MQRLTIVVPYRNRESHLEQFIPHVRAYFARDKFDKNIPYTALIVEQERGLPFNRGTLKNIGFVLGAANSDYTCFHDVDYLPVWADYSWADTPTPLVWYGAEQRPIAPGRSNRVVLHSLDLFFGGALLVPNEIFRTVNGYANDYWGWGYEDEDLKARFKASGIETARRKGTFLPLDHDNEGFKLDGAPTPISDVNERLLHSRRETGITASAAEDGLSSLNFEVITRKPLPDPVPERAVSWEIVTVRLNNRPSPEQQKALAR